MDINYRKASGYSVSITWDKKCRSTKKKKKHGIKSPVTGQLCKMIS